MVNPFFLFIAAFLIVILSFLFGWSGIYPNLTTSTLLFFGVVFILAGILGYFLYRSKSVKFSKVTSNTNIVLLVILVLLGTLFEGIYNKGFPLFMMLRGYDSGYTEFGVPVLHVFLLTFTAFLTTYLFHLMLSEKRKGRFRYAFLFLLSCIPYVLEVNRGMFMMVALNCVTIFLLYIWKYLNIGSIICAIAAGLIFLFLFGVMGNARVNTSYQNGRSPFDSAAIMQIGGATDKFKESKLPKEFFWAYIYASSPLANFQKTVDLNKSANSDMNFSTENANRLVIGELLPDFISKRALITDEKKKIKIGQITPELNVGTALSRPYILFGWSGVIIYIIAIFLIAYLYLYLLFKMNSKFFVVGLSVVNTIFILTIYSNMISATGMSFQLIYPLIFSFINAFADYKNKKEFCL